MARIAKEKEPQEMRMNWGGLCPHPEEDAAVFNRLPAWRQAELLEVRRIVREHPEARAFEIHDPSTGKPYPGQILIRDLIEKARKEREAIPEVPASFKYTIPDGVPLAFLRWHEGETPTKDEVTALLATLKEHVTLERMTEFCTYDGKLVYRKPTNGILAFVWRNARFSAGLDATIPTTVFHDLEDGLSAITGRKISTANYEAVRPIVEFLETKADELVEAVGGNRTTGSLRWGKAAGFIR